MKQVALADIVFDADTQARASISDPVVAEYAEQMTAGATFPPVVLFHDGSRYYMADGFHRGLAAFRVGVMDIAADVRAGTASDALWFALGANKTNGTRLTSKDKRHAILAALKTWPDKSINMIAEQIGANQRYASGIRAEVSATTNLPDRVTGKDGKSYPATTRNRPERVVPPPPAGGVARNPVAVQQRREQIRDMAAEGHSSRQIAAKLGLSEIGCRRIARDAGVDLLADRTIGRAHRHDSTRIVEHIVMDADNLTTDVNLIVFSDLTHEQIAGWLGPLKTSRDRLNTFIRRLMQEQENHEAA
jgi:DNA-binding NarL/FixJ family response regulator